MVKKIRPIRFWGMILLAIALEGHAQFSYVFDQSVPVAGADGSELPLAWAGGLNAPQFNTMDLNNDGQADLVLYDRMTGKISTFVADDGKYSYMPDYEPFFPAEVQDWVFLRDYNCDGKKDLFTRENLGIVVYKNITAPGDPPSWMRVTHDVIYTEGFNNTPINLLPGFNDIPVIQDLDGDGDLDIMNFKFTSPSTIEYHQNLSVESFGNCDSLYFKRITQKYGDLEECRCGTFAFNGESCPPLPGRVKHTQGRSILALDKDHDNDFDLLFSEESCYELSLLPNQGTSQNALFNTVELYPAANPVSLLYPVSFYEDVDFDLVKDLIVSTGLLTKPFAPVDLGRSVMLYHNTGTDADPVFGNALEGFMQNKMIDVGDNAAPAFADADGDGDFDLFISYNFDFLFQSAVYYYENIGTITNPAFQLRDKDYASFSAAGLINLKIQFADINGDAKPDLVFSGSDAQTGATTIFYVPNKSGTSLDFSGQPSQSVFLLSGSLTADNFCITDVSGDGKPDLLIGGADGSLQYFRNTGSTSLPVFTLEDESFLGFSQSLSARNLSCAVADLNADGNPDLIIGNHLGELQIIPDYRHTGGGAPNESLVFNSLRGSYDTTRLGGPVWPTAANLFFTDKPALIVGSSAGGLHLLKNDEGLSLPNEPIIHIFPNPVYRSASIKMQTDRPMSFHLVSLLGQECGGPVFLPANQVISFEIPPDLGAGIYVAVFSVGGKHISRKIVILD